jgi:cholesterol oxidase
MSHQEAGAIQRTQILAGRGWRALGRSLYTLELFGGTYGPLLLSPVVRARDRLTAMRRGDRPPATAPPPQRPANDPGATPMLSFTERMDGHLAFAQPHLQPGLTAGGTDRTRLTCHLTIEVGDLDRFAREPDHEAGITGWVACQPLGGRRSVHHGAFNLLVRQEGPHHRRMLYRMQFTDDAGRPLTLSGYKEVKDDPGFDLWADTSTLYLRLLRGHLGPGEEATAEVVATGVVRLTPLGFLHQLTTFRVHTGSPAQRTATLWRFARLFTSQLHDVYR